jgi:hypothetical protein
MSGIFQYTDLLSAGVKSIPPFVFAQSDQGGVNKFQLIDLLKLFETDILVPIVEACADDRLHLDDDI